MIALKLLERLFLLREELFFLFERFLMALQTLFMCLSLGLVPSRTSIYCYGDPPTIPVPAAYLELLVEFLNLGELGFVFLGRGLLGLQMGTQRLQLLFFLGQTLYGLFVLQRKCKLFARKT